MAKDSGPQPNALEIDPFKPLEEQFNGHGIYRYNIVNATWADNETLKLDALDNNGTYKITLQIDALNKPIIQKLTGAARK